MTDQEIRETLRRRPAVHLLCYGAFLQSPIWLADDLFAVGMEPLGIKTQALYTVRYVNGVLDGTVGEQGLDAFADQGKNSLPVIVILRLLEDSGTPEELHRQAEASLLDGRRALSWVTTEDPVPFAVAVRTADKTFYWPIVPYGRNLMRLGPGDVGPDFHDLVGRLLAASKEDERLGFALALFHDAVREENQLFRVARFFNCLECLAFRIKRSLPSRKAVKHLLEHDGVVPMEAEIEGRRVKFDHIELAGRLRDKLFHGVPFRAEDLNAESRDAYQLLESNPRFLADALMDDAWLSLARWVNGASRDLAEPEDDGSGGPAGRNDS